MGIVEVREQCELLIAEWERSHDASFTKCCKIRWRCKWLWWNLLIVTWVCEIMHQRCTSIKSNVIQCVIFTIFIIIVMMCHADRHKRNFINLRCDEKKWTAICHYIMRKSYVINTCLYLLYFHSISIY